MVIACSGSSPNIDFFAASSSSLLDSNGFGGAAVTKLVMGFFFFFFFLWSEVTDVVTVLKVELWQMVGGKLRHINL